MRGAMAVACAFLILALAGCLVQSPTEEPSSPAERTTYDASELAAWFEERADGFVTPADLEAAGAEVVLAEMVALEAGAADLRVRQVYSSGAAPIVTSGVRSCSGAGDAHGALLSWETPFGAAVAVAGTGPHRVEPGQARPYESFSVTFLRNKDLTPGEPHLVLLGISDRAAWTAAGGETSVGLPNSGGPVAVRPYASGQVICISGADQYNGEYVRAGAITTLGALESTFEVIEHVAVLNLGLPDAGDWWLEVEGNGEQRRVASSDAEPPSAWTGFPAGTYTVRFSATWAPSVPVLFGMDIDPLMPDLLAAEEPWRPPADVRFGWV